MSLFRFLRRHKKVRHYDPLSKPVISHKSAKSRKSRSNIHTSQVVSVIKYLVAGVIALGIVTGVIYASAKVVLKIRQQEESMVVVSTVVGFSDVPEYPYSEYIFKNSQDDLTVNKFVNEGYAVYRLSPGYTIDDVFAYYSELLVEKGWKLAIMVDLGSDDERYGQYWTKNGTGLRIYSNINDIWYQKLSEADAVTGLASEVQKENERKILLSQDKDSSLLPDYPWTLTITPDMLVTYSASTVGDLQTATFKKIGTSQLVYLEPISGYNGTPYDLLLDQYCSTQNITVNITQITTIKSGEALSAKLINKDNVDGEAIVVNNYANSVVYMIYYFGEKTDTFEYIYNNIEPKVTTKIW